MNSCIRLAGLIVVLSVFPCLAAAQDSVKCESNDGRRNYCGNYDNDRVQLERQISGSPCDRGRTWGVDDRGLWVDNGCRAIFTIRERSHGNRGDDNDGRESIKCESNDGRRNYCGNYDNDRVRLERQISGSPCEQGRTWGVDGRGLWVDDGCRAIFTVRGGGDRGRDLDRDRDRDRDDRNGDTDSRSGDSNNGGTNSGGWWDPDPNDTWPPRENWRGGNWRSGGACFYKDRNFGGSFFCVRRGEVRESLEGFGDQISSIRAFGGARVVVFDDRNFSGARDRLAGDQPDLQRLRVSQKRDHTWNNRISSVRVE
jgi:hypothetical protein